MTTEEKNRLIADWMGYLKSGEGSMYNYAMEHSYKYDMLKYHTSWDWLMPVVERIESLGFTFKICRRRVEIDRDGVHGPLPLILVKEPTKMESVYIAVVTFVQRYNKHNQQQPT